MTRDFLPSLSADGEGAGGEDSGRRFENNSGTRRTAPRGEDYKAGPADATSFANAPRPANLNTNIPAKLPAVAA